MVKYFGWLALFLILSPVRGLCFTPPPNDGFLTDAAGILTSEEELSIEGLLQEYAEQTGTEIAIIIVRSVGGETIEDAAKDIAARWRVGVEDLARGIVLLFSFEDRDLFMVIGDGLQGALSPDIAQGIIARDIIPLFRDGDYGSGFEEGVRSIMKHISGEYTSERYDLSPPSLLSVWLVNIVGMVGFTGMIALLWAWWRRDARGSRRRRQRMSS